MGTPGMTYYGGNELAASFRTVRANTIQIAEDACWDSCRI
jgi:hypothetical protein